MVYQLIMFYLYIFLFFDWYNNYFYICEYCVLVKVKIKSESMKYVNLMNKGKRLSRISYDIPYNITSILIDN